MLNIPVMDTIHLMPKNIFMSSIQKVKIPETSRSNSLILSPCSIFIVIQKLQYDL